MASTSPIRHPIRWLFATLGYCLMATVLALAVARSTPWLGLSLKALPDGGVTVVSAKGPSVAVPAGARLRSIAPAAGDPSIELHAEDLREEPDMLPDYAALDGYFARQSAIAAVLSEPRIRLAWDTDRGEHGFTIVEPGQRPLASLPFLFWFHVLVAVSGCLIASWVWVLRPRDPGAALFWITGLLCPAFALPPAVYSSRELAIDGSLFAWLSGMNHFSSAMWGAALVGIFLCHPRRLVRPAWLPGLFVFSGLWSAAGLARLMPDLDWGIRYLLMLQMLLAVFFAALQWRRSRQEPTDRAALRWLILSLLVGSGLFIVTVIASTSLGWMPALPQGYAFGFFLFVYAGIALGLRRYRLFELDAWAYRMLLWIGGALTVILLDAILVLALDWSAAPALGASVWICGLLYFPARQWIWKRLAQRRDPPSLQELMPEALAIALEPSAAVQSRRWDALLERLYDPLELAEAEATGSRRTWVEEDGLAMRVPAVAQVPGRRLRYPRKGGRLFSLQEAGFVEALRTLVAQACNARDAQDRGAQIERRRIARDMHDDVGARLLMLIHRATTPEQADLARAAMTDLRTALAALDAEPVPMAEAVADWRAEAAQRCEAAGVRLDWIADLRDPDRRISSRSRALAERIVREGLTNALKHTSPQRIGIMIATDENALSIRVRNDGVRVPPPQWVDGRGLTGMRQRLAEQGCALDIVTVADGEVDLATRLPFGEEERR